MTLGGLNVPSLDLTSSAGLKQGRAEGRFSVLLRFRSGRWSVSCSSEELSVLGLELVGSESSVSPHSPSRGFCELDPPNEAGG